MSNWTKRQQPNSLVTRRVILAGIAAAGTALALPGAARAQGLGGVLGLGDILGRASDNALDRLAQPGAFYADEAIRIGLPVIGSGSSGSGGLLGRLFSGARDLGVLDGLIRTLNDAAGLAAGEAKPIFRDAIDNVSFTDVPAIVRRDTGATDYLRESSHDRLHARLTPLVDSALSSLGAYTQLDRLAGNHSWLRALGISRDGLNATVTDQGLSGIFTYIGSEERGLRDNPARAVGGVLRGLGL